MLTRRNVKERHERFYDMYNLFLEGSSYSEIGRKYGITKERVRQILKNYCTAEQYEQVRKRIEQRSLATWFGKEIISQLEAGSSCTQIAKNLNCSVSLVKRISTKWNKEKSCA